MLDEFYYAHEASPPGSRAALEAMDHPAHASSAAVFAGDGEMDPRLALAIAQTTRWVVERYR